jgi:two-component system sensor histidine kinase KdpD
VGALILVLLATFLAAVLRRAYGAPDIEIVFFAPIILTAFWWGKRPAILSATLAVASYDFFFVPPIFTFGVSDARYVLSFAMMFVLGWMLGELASRVRNHELEARMRESRTAALYALSRDLGAATDIEKCALATAKHASEVFSAEAIVLFADEGGELIKCASFPAHLDIPAHDLALVRWVYEHDKTAGVGTDTLPGSSWVGAPISVRHSVLGVLALRPRSGESLSASQREFLSAFCGQSAFAFERQQLAIEARQAALRAKTEEMRSSLLSAVSHDLRTPLAAITGAATSLRDDADLPPEAAADLVKSICEEADRLARLVTNLLEMTKLDAGQITLKREWVPLEEIVEPAFARFESKLASHPVSIRIPDDCPPLSVDPVVFQEVFINMIENALKYTPPDSPIELSASFNNRFITIEVRDRGPGLPAGTEKHVFERFFRGPHESARGAGLGLAICKGIVDAHGGTISAENAVGGGALFRIRLPLVGDPSNATSLGDVAPSTGSEVSA